MLTFRISLSANTQSAVPKTYFDGAVLRSSGPVSRQVEPPASAFPSRSVTPLPERSVNRNETTRSLRSLDRFEDSPSSGYYWKLKWTLTIDVDVNLTLDRLLIKKCTNSTNDSTTSFETVSEVQR